MSPVAAPKPETPSSDSELDKTVLKLAQLKPISHRWSNVPVPTGPQKEWLAKLPAPTRARFERHGIDLSHGYPVIPGSGDIPKFVDEAFEIRNKEYPHIERGLQADPAKSSLLTAAKEVKHLTKRIGTEIVGLQLSDLTNQQRDELARLVAERVVVFFRDQDLSPQKQLELGKYYGQVEKHPQAAHVPLPPSEDDDNDDKAAKGSGVTTIWQHFFQEYYQVPHGFKSRAGSKLWHTDLVHERDPSAIVHLHVDTIPEYDGDTVWASGYGAYDKLSKPFQQWLDGKTAIYHSAHQYINRENPLSGPKFIEREHPLVITHPVTGWKSLFVNRSMTSRIVGLEPEESKVILEYLFGLYEDNLDIQVRFHWQPAKEGLGTSAIWDNRVSQHYAIPYDYEGVEDRRHGTRVTSLAPLSFDPNSKSQRESLGLPV